MTSPDLQPLPWDSEFLGFAVGGATVPAPGAAAVAALAAEARRRGLRLTYLFLDPADTAAAAAAQHAGAYLTDRKVTFQGPVEAPYTRPEPFSDAVVRIRENEPGLEELAWQSGEYSRFRLDPQFAPGVFGRLYSHWYQASLGGELARAVFACRSPEGRPTGLLTLQPQSAAASIGLLAVHTAARGQGRGRALVAAARQAAREWGCRELRVTTQLDNELACRFYAHCGFTVAQVVHVYHLWQ